MVTTAIRSGRRFGVAPAPWHLRPEDAPSGIVSRDDTACSLDAGAFTPPPPRSGLRPGPLWKSVHFIRRQGDMLFRDAARHGEVLTYDFAGLGVGSAVVVCNPAHITSLMTADPEIAPSATGRSPLRPIVGANSVLTSVGARHRRQRALLMPRFHGAAVASYQESIARATAARIDAWPVGESIPLAHLAQHLTLDVIMSAVFGLTDGIPSTDAERALRISMTRLLRLSTRPVATAGQVMNGFSENPVGITRMVLRPVDRAIAAILAERRAEQSAGGRADIAALLLDARTEDGEPLSDDEIRDELLTLVLAGHETTANMVAWTFERLTRSPAVYADAKDAIADDDDTYLAALINETMRVRPVVPMIARELLRPWIFGDTVVPEGSVALVSVLLLHHRDDLYPHPFAFDPGRFLDARPAPHTLMPFGGGNRRCLGAPLAMAELTTVVGEILKRVDLETHDRPAERPRHRNVTMIPEDGGLVRAKAIR